MLARIGAFAIALLITIVGMGVWYVFSMLYPFVGIAFGPSSLRLDGPPFTIAAVLLIASIALFRKRRSWPLVASLVGAAALFVARLHDIVVGLGLDLQWTAAKRLLFGFGCLETSAVTTPINVLRILGLLVPLGFLFYATPIFQRHLTMRSSEPRASLRFTS